MSTFWHRRIGPPRRDVLIHSASLFVAVLLGTLRTVAENPAKPAGNSAPPATAQSTPPTGESRKVDAGWVTLFNGRNLDGWEQHSGQAEYRVEDGCIVGKTVAGTGNSFLCTTRTYGDFVFEFEFKVAADMNSGVQFRSEFFREDTFREIDGKRRKFAADRVHGYQFEIDPSPRAYTGGIYDESRRGWLVELKNHEAARKAFKPGEWNQGRIECRGDQIQTWINNVPAASLKDSLTLKGILALQVHSIGDGTKRKAGGEIRWRNLRLKEL